MEVKGSKLLLALQKPVLEQGEKALFVRARRVQCKSVVTFSLGAFSGSLIQILAGLLRHLESN